MLKETGYDEKIEMLRPWLTEIIDVVKKDLRNEHLKMDKQFVRRYFLGKNTNQLTANEMADAYAKDIADGNVGLGEFIATRWLIKNTDIYGYFEEMMKTISEDFDEIEALSQEQSAPVLKGALKDYGPTKTYIFSVFNSVVFPKEIFDQLRTDAEKETTEEKVADKEREEAHTLENLKKRHAREMRATAERYEKKYSGMQRKYLNDTESLKKRIAQLQKKLESV